MQQEPPSHSTSIAPSLAIDPPHIQAEQAVGLPAMAEGRLKRISKPPPCGTGGHKHGHKAGPEASDEEHARPPPRYTRQPKVQKSLNIVAWEFMMCLGFLVCAYQMRLAKEMSCSSQTPFPTLKTVTISYTELKDKKADLSLKIEEGFGPNGLGILSITDVLEFPSLHRNLLRLSPSLPEEVKKELEDPHSRCRSIYLLDRDKLHVLGPHRSKNMELQGAEGVETALQLARKWVEGGLKQFYEKRKKFT
nr:hypothetical protein CFP56_33935 [Quercus suber]